MAGDTHDIITLVDSCVDLIVSGGDIVPRFGQVEQLVSDYCLELGGSCAIFACQAAKLGLRVAALGRVGDDDLGRFVVRRLDGCGVDISRMTADPALKTGLGIALCRGHDRAILTYPGSLAALTPDDVTDAFLASGRHLHYGSYFLQTGLGDAAPDMLGRAHDAGLTISLDTNWDPEERWDGGLREALSKVDVFLPNEREALAISGGSTLAEGAAWYRELGIPLVVVKRGMDGAVAWDAQGEHRCGVAPAGPGGDSVGAGDSFDAGFLAGWLRGLSIERCLAIGCCCGRHVAGSVGGVRGQPTWGMVLDELGLAAE